MSRSNKARNGTRTKRWKDTVGRSANQARSRAKWKKVKKNTKHPTYGSMRKPTKKPKESVHIITGSGIYDSRTKSIEPFDDD